MSNWEDGWEERSDGFWYKTLDRGDRLIWHPSIGGTKHSNHIHLSAKEANDAWGSYKPLRTWLKDNGILKK